MMNDTFKKVYVTRPIKNSEGYWTINMYNDGELIHTTSFFYRVNALRLMRKYDNWDKLCERVKRCDTLPAQGELELVA